MTLLSKRLFSLSFTKSKPIICLIVLIIQFHMSTTCMAAWVLLTYITAERLNVQVPCSLSCVDNCSHFFEGSVASKFLHSSKFFNKLLVYKSLQHGRKRTFHRAISVDWIRVVEIEGILSFDSHLLAVHTTKRMRALKAYKYSPLKIRNFLLILMHVWALIDAGKIKEALDLYPELTLRNCNII